MTARQPIPTSVSFMAAMTLKLIIFLNEMKELACRRKWMTGINQVSGTSARGRWCPMALSKAASRHLILLKIENCFHTERRTERFVRLLVNKSRTRIAISAGEVGFFRGPSTN